jgi:hypothetical protein
MFVWGKGEITMTAGKENAELVREIVKEAHRDAEQILLIIDLLRYQHSEGMDARLKAKGALDASKVISDALKVHLVTIITLQYSELYPDDLSLRKAFDILKSKQDIRDEFKTDGSDDALVEAEKSFANLLKDERLKKIKDFRNKRAVHRAQPTKIPPKVQSELYSFACNTVEVIEKLASAIKLPGYKPARDCIDPVTANAFWRPWKAGA